MKPPNGGCITQFQDGSAIAREGGKVYSLLQVKKSGQAPLQHKRRRGGSHLSSICSSKKEVWRAFLNPQQTTGPSGYGSEGVPEGVPGAQKLLCTILEC